MRPKRPAGPDDPTWYDMCGEGNDMQMDIHPRRTTPTKPSDYQMFSIFKKGTRNYFPELVKVSKQINKILQKEAVPYLIKRQKKENIQSLEITIGFSQGHLYLTYAIPKGRQKLSPKEVIEITKMK